MLLSREMIRLSNFAGKFSRFVGGEFLALFGGDHYFIDTDHASTGRAAHGCACRVFLEQSNLRKLIFRTAAILGLVLATSASALANGEISVWRPSNGIWYSLTSASNFTTGWTSPVRWGVQSNGDVPFLGDVDGDGVRDLIAWRASTGVWYALTSSTGYDPARAIVKAYGGQGDIPLVADMDGDGKVDFTVWRGSSGTFYWLTSSSRYTAGGGIQFGRGSLGDQPLIGDFDGDGKSDLAVWRASNGTFYWITSSTSFNYAATRGIPWGSGTAGDVPKVGDVDGDGKADLLVWRAPSGTWFWLTSSSGYTAAGSRMWGSGSVGDIPLLGDFDRDGRADIAVWRPGKGAWYWLTAVSGFSTAGTRMWGGFGDVPLVFEKFRNTRPGGAATAPPPAPAPTPAPSPSSGGVQLRVLQWNIHHGGFGTDGVYSTERIANWVVAMKPDVILFNEMEKNTSWGREDQPEVYKRLLQQKTGKTWYYVFAQEFGDWSSNGKGNMIMSTYPLSFSGHYEIARNGDRTIAMAGINVNGRNITLVGTHLDPYDASLRLVQAAEVTTWSAAQPENRILAGDMNAWPDQTSIGQFNKTYYDSWTVAASQGTAVAFAGNSGQTKNGRIDYIFYSKTSPNLAVKSSQVYDTRDSSGVMPSDHRPVLTTFVVR